MRTLTRAGKKNPTVRQTAILLTQGLRQKDYYQEIVTLFRFVQDRIRYVKDIRDVETLHTPEVVLVNKQGDCDDKSVLLASLLESLGHRTRFIAVGFKPDTYSHVYPEVYYNGQWLPLETTEKVRIGWTPDKIVSRLVVGNDGPGALSVGTLDGKRVKAVLAQRAADAAATAAAAAANPDDPALQAAAASAAAVNAAEQAAFSAKEATKPKGFAKVVSKVKAVRARVDPVAKAQEFAKTAKKEGFKAAIAKEKETLKAEHLKATKLIAATGSPSFKKHAQFEENKYKAKDLKAQLVAIQEQRAVADNPYWQQQEASVSSQLNQIADENKQYIKQGKIASAIASVVIGFFSFGGGSAVIDSAVQAVKQGAMDIAKKLLMGAIAAGIAKGGSKEDAAKAQAAVNTLSSYPPDPSLNTLDEMIADSEAKKTAAQQKTLGWLIPIGIAVFTALT